MKAYVLITGALFGVLTVAHIWRMISEKHGLATDLVYLPITLISAALCLWAVLLLARPKK